MGMMKYVIEIHDLKTRLALRYLLMENFEIGKLEVRHFIDGEETTMTFSLHLKSEKWKDQYRQKPQ